MDLDTFIVVVCLIVTLISYFAGRYCEKNVYLRYAGDRQWRKKNRKEKSRLRG